MLWFASPWSIRWEATRCNNLFSFLNCLMDPKDTFPVHPDDKENFFIFSVTIMEHLWWTRNRVVYGANLGDIEQSMRVILNKFNEVKASRSSVVVGRPMSIIRDHSQVWIRPPHGFIKINSDAALSETRSCLALIVRNDRGLPLTIQTFKSGINIAEAILRALQMALKFGWDNIMVESDALNIIGCLANRDKRDLHWKAHHIASDIFLLSQNFVNASFVWVPRAANRVAHSIGQWAKRLSFFGEVDYNHLPSSILLNLIQDSDSVVAA
nr:uncharacterized protein LOC125418432 [Ziziphus jujuba var. spinosa]